MVMLASESYLEGTIKLTACDCVLRAITQLFVRDQRFAACALPLGFAVSARFELIRLFTVAGVKLIG